MFDAVRPGCLPSSLDSGANGARSDGGRCLRAPARRACAADGPLLHRVATGFFAAVPDDRVGTEWMPGVEAAAVGVAVAAYGRDDAVVMGVSAARLHGVVPRALANAVVAVPTRHDPIRLADRQAVGRFVVRYTARLDAEPIDTELGFGGFLCQIVKSGVGSKLDFDKLC